LKLAAARDRNYYEFTLNEPEERRSASAGRPEQTGSEEREVHRHCDGR